MSSDGRYVAFSSVAANLVTESGTSTAPGTGRQVYLRDTCFGVSGSCTPSTQLISTDPNGTLVGTGRHSAIAQRFGTICRVPGRNAEPRILQSGIPVNSCNEQVRRKRKQQRLPPGFRARHLSWHGELHAEDHAHFAATWRRFWDGNRNGNRIWNN